MNPHGLSSVRPLGISERTLADTSWNSGNLSLRGPVLRGTDGSVTTGVVAGSDDDVILDGSDVVVLAAILIIDGTRNRAVDHSGTLDHDREVRSVRSILHGHVDRRLRSRLGIGPRSGFDGMPVLRIDLQSIDQITAVSRSDQSSREVTDQEKLVLMPRELDVVAWLLGDHAQPGKERSGLRVQQVDPLANVEHELLGVHEADTVTGEEILTVRGPYVSASRKSAIKGIRISRTHFGPPS